MFDFYRQSNYPGYFTCQQPWGATKTGFLMVHQVADAFGLIVLLLIFFTDENKDLELVVV